MGVCGETVAINKGQPSAHSTYCLPSKNGRGERIRTSDHRNPIAVRYQTALRPVQSYTTKLRSQEIRNICEFLNYLIVKLLVESFASLLFFFSKSITSTTYRIALNIE